MSKRKNLFLLFILILSAGLSFNSYAGPTCGDGKVEGDEECDEGNVSASSICTNTTDQGDGTCTWTRCGDGVKQPTANHDGVLEECDEGLNATVSTLCNNTTDQFDGACQFTICGDNVVQTPNGSGGFEQCEPPNTASCDTICMDVTTTTAATTSSTAATTSSTAATTSSTGATTSSTAATTSSTGATTSSTAATTSSTAATTSSTDATTSSTGVGSTTTSSGATTTTTTAASTTTTAASTTTTTLPQGSESVKDEPLAGSKETVTIKTEPGQTITAVSTDKATNAPSGYDFPFGTISYTTSSPVGGDVTMRFKFSADLPGKLTVFKVDKNGNYTELPTNLWKKIDDRTIDVTVTDGDALTDMDGAADGSTEDPIAVAGQQSSGGGGGGGDDDDLFDFGGGGCTIGNTQSAGMDPIWLFLLLAPGLGILRRRAAATGTAKKKGA